MEVRGALLVVVWRLPISRHRAFQCAWRPGRAVAECLCRVGKGLTTFLQPGRSRLDVRQDVLIDRTPSPAAQHCEFIPRG